VELLVELRQAAVGEIDDDKAEVIANADDTTVQDICRAGDWLIGRFVGSDDDGLGHAIVIRRLNGGGIVRLWAFASRSAEDKNDTDDRERILHRAGLNTRFSGETSILRQHVEDSVQWNHRC